MSRAYEVGVSEDGKYVYARVTRQTITLVLAEAFTRELTKLGGASGIRRCLVDVRGARSVAGVSGEYQYAYEKAEMSGFTHQWRMAVLKDRADTSHDFLQTVMDNAGRMFKLFNDEAEAVAWLTQTEDPARWARPA